MTGDAAIAAAGVHAALTFTGERFVEDALVVIGASGRVVALAAADDPRWAALPVERLPGHALLPGFADAHSHAFQRAIRGRVQHRGGGGGAASSDSFWSWREAMYRAANGLDPEGVEAISALAYLELLRAGVTAVGEFHYLHHAADGAPYADPDELAARVVSAARGVGLRIAVLRVCYGQGGLGADGKAQPLRADQRRFASRGPDDDLHAIARLRARFAADASAVTIGLAPHSVRAVPFGWLPAFAGFAGPLHAHVAEQPAEVAACRAAYGCGPLQVFADAGLVSPRFAAVHLTHPEPTDAALLRAADAAVVVCPSTELDLGDGFLPLALRRGVRLAVGSDSYAAVEPLAEARSVELHGRALAGERLLLGTAGAAAADGQVEAQAILRIASAHGHRALELPGGSLEVGAPFDACALDLRRPEALGVPPWLAASHVARPEWVSDVWVQGRRLLRGGHHDSEEEIMRRADRALRALWATALLLAALPFAAGCAGKDTATSAGDIAADTAAAADASEADGAGGADVASADAATSDGTGAACQIAADCPAPSAACRVAACQAGVGCIEVAMVDGAICQDADPCLLAGQCQGGHCQAGPPKPCNDGNPCTTDSCQGGVCAHPAADGASCDDGEACTKGDTCSGGVCVGGAAICQCQAHADCGQLDDPCKGKWYCDKSGQTATCKPNPATVIVCPPSTSPCLEVSCDAASASCKAKPVADGLLIACDDGDACSAGDICQGGACLPGADVCGCTTDAQCEGQDDGDLCNGTMYCDKAAKPPKCTHNPATVVSCPSVDDTACAHAVCEPKTGACKTVAAADGKPCDDGTTCTTGEVCAGGSCAAATNTCACQSDADCSPKDDGDLCNGTLFCDKAAGGGKAAVCKLNPATVVTCKSVDDTFCLANACAPKSGTCAMAPRHEGEGCSDGNPCTLNDSCAAGVCKAGTFADPCQCQADSDCAAQEDGDLCNGTLYCDKAAPPFVCKVNPSSVKACSAAFDGPCTGAVCEPKSGACLLQPKNNGLPCDDGAPCTKGDFCQAGQCKAGAEVCACKADLDCLGKDDGNLCNGVPFCDKSALPWQCETNPASVVTCKTVDDTTCRKAICTPKTGICELVPINQGIACDDGTACTADDVCKSGGCKGAAIACDDGVACTVDGCDPATGCSHAVNLSLCDDGVACTSDGCDPKAQGADAVGCTHSAQTGAACDDGSACSEADACVLGVCQGKPKTCADGNPCTDDTCDANKGCAHPPNAAPCKSDKPCQPLGACAAGACVALPASMWSALADDKAVEVPAAVAAAADGSTIVVGRSAPPGGKAEDGSLWLARLAAGGTPLYAKTLGAEGDDAAFAVAALVAPTLPPGAAAGPGDVLALIAGRRAAGSKGGTDGWVLRVGADGVPAWQQHVGGAGDDALHGLAALPDGACAAVGRLGSGDTATALVARLDPQGTVLWSTALPQAGAKAGVAFAVDPATATAGTAAGGGAGGAPSAWLVAGGRTDDKGVEGAFAAKVDDDGNVLWQAGLGVGKGGDLADAGRAVRATPAGGALVAGGAGAAGRLVHVTGDGKVAWDLGFGAAGGGALSGLGALHEGAALAVGTTKDEAGKKRVWLLRVDLAGTLLGQQTLQPAHAAAPPAVATFADGRVAVVAPADAAGDAAVVEVGARVQVLDAFGFATCEAQGACKGKERADCNDNNACTHDTCSADLGCTHQVHALPCDDGDVCSLGEACKAGKCIGSKGACDDGNPCSEDSCEAGKGCAHSKLDGPCDDGEPCSSGEVCQAGVCQPGKLVDCDDGNACTDDNCQKGKGCEHIANSVACDTGSCTVGDACQGGLCKTSALPRYTTTWHGQKGDDSARKVRALTDNGLLISGLTWTKPDSDGLLVRTDATGKALWTLALEGPKGCCGGNSNQNPSHDRLEDAIETPNGLLAVGRTSVCLDQSWVLMVDLQGKVLWNKVIIPDDTCGTPYHRGIFFAAAPGNDGSWAVAGYNFYHPYTGTNYRAHVARVNQSGAVLSQKVHGGMRQIFDLQARPGGGYFAAGEILDGGLGNQGRLALLDADGDVVWAANIHVANTSDADYLVRVAPMPDGGALGVGYGGGTGARQILALRLHASGAVRYSRALGTVGDDIGVGVVSHADGSAMLLATTWGKGPGAGDAWLIGVDPAGNSSFERIHGGPGAELAAHLERRADGGLALLATATEPLETQPDVQLRTLDAWGYGDCKAAGSCSALPPLACDDANACTADVCDGGKGCTHAGLAEGTSCGAGLSCKGGVCKP